MVRRIEDSRDDANFQKILRKVRQLDVTFYFIAVNSDLNPGTVDARLNPSTDYAPLAIYNLQQIRLRMQQIAENSGGRMAFPKKPADVNSLYEQIASELGTNYSLSYTPQRSASGNHHRIEVRVRGEGMRVRQSRDGYTEP